MIKSVISYLTILLLFSLVFNSSNLNCQIVAEKSSLPNNLPSKALIDAKRVKLSELGRLNGQGNLSYKATGIEQDCDGAISVCSQSYTQSTSYTGFGSTQEVNYGCMEGSETNSVWYIFTAQTSGNFGFQLNTIIDYDWSLFDITTVGCSGIPASLPIRCNFSATEGSTGMDGTGTNPSESDIGSPFSTELAIVAGETYALIIDNWTGDLTGYSLDFTTGGGYASITDVTDPVTTNLSPSCSRNSVFFYCCQWK